MMDIVFIKNLKIDAVIGVFDWEREIKQALYFDFEMAADISKAANSDELKDTLDYNALSIAVTQFVGKSSFQLIETLAERVAELIIQDFNVPWLRLRLNKKGAIKNADDVGIIIERGIKT